MRSQLRPRLLVPLLAAAALMSGAAGAAETANSCVDCHQVLPEPLGTPVEGMEHDVHAKAGLSCADCHGGDPTDAGDSSMDPAIGFVGKPAAGQIPAFCGRCHSDKRYMRRFDPNIPTGQVAEYETSQHGIALAAGNEHVATCISCHGVHGIRPAADADSPIHKTRIAATCGGCHANPKRMAGSDLPINQLTQYLRSVHGTRLIEDRDLAAPTCNDCHGNHGAAPPGVDGIGAVCGTCHVIQHDLFMKSPHQEPFERLALGACSSHHGHHDVAPTSDEMTGVGELSVCVPCHAAGSPGYEAAEAMGETVQALVTAIERASASLTTAAHAGMEVSEAEYQLQTAHDALIQTRNLVHTADPAQVQAGAAEGMTVATQAERVGRDALLELSSRRWMAIIPLGMIALVCVLLYLKIRSLGGGLGRER